jgi:hypothetical protein
MTPRFQVDSDRAQNISISRRNELQHHHNFICKSVLIPCTLKPHGTLDRSILVTELPAYRSRDSAVGIAIGYGMDDRGVGVRVLVESRIFSSTRRPDRLWGPPSLLSNGYRGLFLRG